MRYFTRKSHIKHEVPIWAEIMEMALAFHVPPWEIEKDLTLRWWNRWKVWKAEQPEK